ncbi:hypothetical protein AVEN_234155-1 [Araneus ventricosus]|uniref:Uncharacterized protein n=1 Tax=Araneus ventricosus TaxID=182803 RepID=A0A4Y1ZRV7_ARAVE|nr:hypothetical protein AVEN_234155-1 [Araneus ventricosus]
MLQAISLSRIAVCEGYTFALRRLSRKAFPRNRFRNGCCTDVESFYEPPPPQPASVVKDKVSKTQTAFQNLTDKLSFVYSGESAAVPPVAVPEWVVTFCRKIKFLYLILAA